MATWAPLRADVIAELGAELLATFPKGRILIGVDGFDDARTSAFSRDLAGAIRADGVDAGVLRLARFGGYGHGAYREAYAVDAFRTSALADFRAGRSLPTDEGRGTVLAGADRSVLVVCGRYLLRPDLVGIWHSTVWLNSPLDDAAADAIDLDRGKRYLREVDPKRRANANIDATDPAHPRRTFADSC